MWVVGCELWVVGYEIKIVIGKRGKACFNREVNLKVFSSAQHAASIGDTKKY